MIVTEQLKANHSVFLSYTRKDRDRVTPFHEYLMSNGISAWIDHKCLRPGQNWDFEIKRALENASIIVFLSHNSVIKRGYVQREVKYALDRRKEKMIDDIYVLPVLLDDDVELPTEFADVHYASTSSDHCLIDIRDAVTEQLKRLGTYVVQSEDQAQGLRWSFTKYRDFSDGIPGYEVEYHIPTLQSVQYEKLNEITDIIKGDCIKELMKFRKFKFDRLEENYDYGQEKWRRNHSFSAVCGDPIVTGRCVSVVCEDHFYYARAAHPNMGYRTYSFFLDPLFHIESIDEIFEHPDDALSIIVENVRASLFKDIVGEAGDEDVSFDKELIANGVSNWGDLSKFILRNDGVQFLFPPYQVASYAHGPQSAKVPYDVIGNLIFNSFLYALDLDQYVWKKQDKLAALLGSTLKIAEP